MGRSLPIYHMRKIQILLHRRTKKIISDTHSFKSELIERWGEGHKIDVVLNGVDLSKYEPAPNKDDVFTEQYELTDKFIDGNVVNLNSVKD
tara:strand:- start:1700 stop:1972 length:273 start_codon:yes stop_codon:yes gene_type:complete